jgi:(R,R)-butanediol dehydrogenase/meso-butanediol dehydrogenase/diacetyl reductase
MMERDMMRALKWHAAHDIRLEKVEVPTPKDNEVVVAVAYCGICGSDLHEYDSGPHAIPIEVPHKLSGSVAPIIIGHEFCGTVVQVGSSVRNFKAGDRVSVEPEYRCQQCAYCETGSYNLCVSMGFAGLMGDGGMAEFAVIPAYMLHHLPDTVSFEQAATFEPAAVALHALRRAELKLGDTCAVFGLGPIGLLLVALAKLQGATTIVAVDVSEERLNSAKQAGATHVFNGREFDSHELVQAIQAETNGLGVDVSFEAAGLNATLENGLQALRKGGKLVMVGLMPEAKFNSFDMVNNELSLIASVGYRHVYEELIQLVANKMFDPSFIVTKVVPLERTVTDGFDALLKDRSQIKILVAPNLSS